MNVALESSFWPREPRRLPQRTVVMSFSVCSGAWLCLNGQETTDFQRQGLALSTSKKDPETSKQSATRIAQLGEDRSSLL